jgi:hypothetical protein
MVPDPRPETRSRRAPKAECRLCSVSCSIVAPSPDALRRGLRAFMTEHRHDGVADIVIDLCDDGDDPRSAAAPVAQVVSPS